MLSKQFRQQTKCQQCGHHHHPHLLAKSIIIIKVKGGNIQFNCKLLLLLFFSFTTNLTKEKRPDTTFSMEKKEKKFNFLNIFSLNYHYYRNVNKMYNGHIPPSFRCFLPFQTFFHYPFLKQGSDKE